MRRDYVRNHWVLLDWLWVVQYARRRMEVDRNHWVFGEGLGVANQNVGGAMSLAEGGFVRLINGKKMDSAAFTLLFLRRDFSREYRVLLDRLWVVR